MAERKSILTLNLGSQRVGMARFTAGGKGTLQISSYAFAEIAGDPSVDATRAPQVAGAVKSLVSQLKAARESVFCAISGQPVLSKFVKLPPLELEKVDELIGFEAQQSIPWPLPEVAWDHQVLNKSGTVGEMEAVLVAIKADALTELNDAVEAGPLVTQLMDVAPLALYNAFRFNYPEVTTPTLLVDIGARTVNLIYAEGAGKVFFRTLQNVGGGSVTTSIAKEFAKEYHDAEQQKITDGFVALSGYADHEDPEIASLSKVIRNALTRTHGEIVRTTNLYRSQQGGSAPEQVFLCGAGSSLPYVKEFLEEKLNLPVEYFNALRAVAIGPKLTEDQVAHDRHCLGELVGLALRGSLSCPMEIDLQPPVVALRRENAARKPFLFAAAAALIGLLAAGGLYHRAAASALASRNAELAGQQSQLKADATKISGEDSRAERERARADYLANAVADRTYWLGLCNELNGLMKDDLIWITQLQPTTGDPGIAITEALAGEPKQITFTDPLKPVAVKAPPQRSSTPQADAAPRLIDGVHLFGLYRDSDKGAEVVTDYFNEIKNKSRLFEIDPNIETSNYVRTDSVSGDKWAYSFEMRLPLRRKVPAVTSIRQTP